MKNTYLVTILLVASTSISGCSSLGAGEAIDNKTKETNKNSEKVIIVPIHDPNFTDKLLSTYKSQIDSIEQEGIFIAEKVDSVCQNNGEIGYFIFYRKNDQLGVGWVPREAGTKKPYFTILDYYFIPILSKEKNMLINVSKKSIIYNDSTTRKPTIDFIDTKEKCKSYHFTHNGVIIKTDEKVNLPSKIIQFYRKHYKPEGGGIYTWNFKN